MKIFVYICSLLNVIATAVFLALYPENTVAVHYNIYGEADRWGNKWVYFIFAVVPLLLCVIYAAVDRYMKKHKKYVGKNRGIQNKILPPIFLFLIIINWVILTPLYAPNISMGDVIYFIPMALSLLMLIMGNFMGKVKQNHWLGFRIKWTLENEVVWKKTHRLFGLQMVIASVINFVWCLICLVNSWQVMLFIGFFIILFIPIIWSSVYSYKIYKKETAILN